MPRLNTLLLIIACVLFSACGGGGSDSSATAPDTPPPNSDPKLELTDTPSGTLATYSTFGFINRDNPFFMPLGNGRRCVTCHVQNDAWSLTPSTVQKLFASTDGKDALFMPIDAANSPAADVSTTEARKMAYSMLLNKAVFRMPMTMPGNAEFTLEKIDDPYGYASSNELTLFRRSLPAANLKFQSTMMWDGRDTVHAGTGDCISGTQECYAPIATSLTQQAMNALTRHAQTTTSLPASQLNAIIDFESSLFTAQITDYAALNLTGAQANGGPVALHSQNFYFGINDTFTSDYKTKQTHTDKVMTMFDAWAQPGANLVDANTPASQANSQASARQSIARGEILFNTRKFTISSVAGFNDELGSASISGSCSTCHNAPNVGTHSTPRMFNTGVSDALRRTADLPLYTLKNNQTGALQETTDPGAAMQTGKWKDIGKFKVPGLRALAARPPYFHNGSANDVQAVVNFYNTRFNMGLTTQEQQDLIAFLKAL